MQSYEYFVKMQNKAFVFSQICSIFARVFLGMPIRGRCLSYSFNTVCSVKITVVIPIYNVQDTLDRCVGSVLAQGVDDMQVILVDDGSTDNSSRLCDQWAEKDNRVEVMHQPNGGLSHARNMGIEKSEGDFITFVDSDDFLEENTYALLLPILMAHPEYDVLEFPVCVQYGGPDERMLNFREDEYRSLSDYWLRGGGYRHTYAWNKIYRRGIFKEVRYPEGVLFEDVHTLPDVFAHCRCLATASVGRYYYCANKQGITATASGTQIRMLLEGYLKVVAQCPEVLEDDNFYMELVNKQIDVCRLTGDSVSIPRRRIRQISSLSSSALRWKARFINLFGLSSLCRFMKLFKSIKA